MVMYDDLCKGAAVDSNAGNGRTNVSVSPKRRARNTILDTIHIVSRVVGGEL